MNGNLGVFSCYRPDWYADYLVTIDENESPKDLQDRIKEISSLLRLNEDLWLNLKLTERLWKFCENVEDPITKSIQAELLNNTCCPIKVLTVSEGEVEERGDKLWTQIENHQVEKLIVLRKKGLPIEFQKGVIESLVKLKPPFETLTDMYHLIFKDGEIEMSYAHLLVCGEIFETMINDPLHNVKNLRGFFIPFVIFAVYQYRVNIHTR